MNLLKPIPHLFLTALLFLCLISCNDDENKGPSSFTVTVDETASNFAVISWTPPTDPDADLLFTTIKLDGKIVLSDSVAAESFRFENLDGSKTYTGVVSITDKINIPTEASFQFTTGPNQSPENFEVTVTEIGQTFATIDWGTLKDPEGDALYVSVLIDGETVKADIISGTSYTIKALKPSTTYSGVVSVTDKKSEPTVATFTFTTKKYVTLFDKVVSKYNSQYLQGFAVCQTNDKGYAVGANFSDGNAYGLFVLKYDSLGTEQWHTGIEAHHETAFDGMISQTKDGGYVIVDQASITKLNTTGDLQWQKVPAMWQSYNSAIETDGSGFIVVGMMGGTDPAKAGMTKYDGDGNLEWEKFFDGSAEITMSGANQIVKASGDNYFLAGTHQRPSIDFELAAAMIDGSGNILWVKNYPYNQETFYLGVRARSIDNNNFIIGSTSLDTGGGDEARLVRISESGDLIWDQSFDWSPETKFKDVTVPDDGNILFVGGYGDQIAMIVKVDANGQLLWKKDFTPTDSGYLWELRAVEQTKDSGFIFMGIKAYVWSSGGSDTDSGLWLLKTDKDGEEKDEPKDQPEN